MWRKIGLEEGGVGVRVFETNDKAIINKLIMGYSIIICNPVNHEELMKKNPNVTYTISQYVEEGEVICLNDWELYWRGENGKGL